MKKIIVDNEKKVSYLEALSYEVEARKALLAHLIKAGVKSDDAAFSEYHNEYREFYAQYELAKNAFEAEYVRPLSCDGRRLDWSLDFQSRELTVEGVD